MQSKLLIIFFAAAMTLACNSNAEDSSVTVPFAFPAQIERNQWWEKLQWPDSDCPRKVIRPNRVGVESDPIAADKALIQVECFSGAYQMQQIYYLSDSEKQLHLLSFDQFNAIDKDILEPYRSPLLLGLVTFDTDEAQFTVLRKYRGIGDCGQLLVYDLQETSPKLHSLRLQECDDNAPYIEPELWPLVSIPPLEP